MMRRERAQLADQGLLAHFLDAQRGDDLLDHGRIVADERPVELAHRFDQVIGVLRKIFPAEQMLELRLETREAWREFPLEPVNDGEIRFVHAVHVASDRRGYDVGGVVVTDVEDEMAFVLVGTDKLGTQSDVVRKKRIRNNATAASEGFYRDKEVGSNKSDMMRTTYEAIE
jgi:hypothetical protein